MSDDLGVMLDLLRPALRPIAQETIAAAVRAVPGVHMEQAKVEGVTPLDGTADVRFDSGVFAPGVAVAGDLPAPGERLWVAVFPPHSPVAFGRVGGQQRRLGRSVDVVAPVALSTTPTVVASVVAVTQPNRRVEIVCHLPAIQNGAAGALTVGLFVHEDATYIGNVADVQFSANGQSVGVNGVVARTNPAGGPHVYYLWATCSAGTATALADVEGVSPGPVWIAVDDRGSSTA